MKNLVWAIAGLIIIILVGFVFFYKSGTKSDTLIPSSINLASQTPNLVNLNSKESTVEGQKMQLPFPVLTGDQINGKKIKISTDKGDIVFELTSDSPIAASNFLYLVNKKFYDGLLFHRVIKGFMIQGGDPKGDGTGGPGYTFREEKITNDGKYQRGIVAMAKRGDEPSGTGGSQFFIMQADYPLPADYAIFGKVVSGLDVVDLIANSQTDSSDKPVTPVVMKTVTVE